MASRKTTKRQLIKLALGVSFCGTLDLRVRREILRLANSGELRDRLEPAGKNRLLLALEIPSVVEYEAPERYEITFNLE